MFAGRKAQMTHYRHVITVFAPSSRINYITFISSAGAMWF